MRSIKRTGPGGQHRNKVATGVTIQHAPTQIVSEANERRERLANLTQALFRLRLNLALEIRISRAQPTRRWESRCRNGRIQIRTSHGEFPALLAEALDWLHQDGFQFPLAARHLNCSASQLLKLISQEPRALAICNGEREKLGLPRIRR